MLRLALYISISIDKKELNYYVRNIFDIQVNQSSKNILKNKMRIRIHN